MIGFLRTAPAGIGLPGRFFVLPIASVQPNAGFGMVLGRHATRRGFGAAVANIGRSHCKTGVFVHLYSVQETHRVGWMGFRGR